MNEIIIQHLMEVELFQGFDPVALKLILEQYRTPLLVYPADHLVMLRGDSIESLHILIKGQLRAQIQGLNGKNLRIEVLKTHQIVASGILFSRDNRLPVSLYTETEVEMLSIPKTAVLALCRENQDFILSYFTEMGDKITFLAEKIRLFQFTTIKQKIAGYLLGQTGDRKLSTIRLVYGREVLAELMSVTRPALSREISALVHDGIIEVQGRVVNITDRQALEDLLADG
ncbi:MAG: Crp/Fnr family transcriptional regulator [Spirochaetales bacterium]|nr:Crp/Fnr family transcriptional regulator [Spirochaetales bacterium]